MTGTSFLRLPLLVALAALVCVPAAAVTAEQAVGAARGPEATDKKRCRLVARKVRGKTRKVRVCTTVRVAPPKAPAKERNVSLTFDSAHSAVAVIGTAGGRVTASEADGTRLTLDLPAGALPEETAITVTPVTAMNTPAGVRLVGGAQFGPEGLGLSKAATLTIELPNRSVGALDGFAWHGQGRNVHRYPVRASGRVLTLRVSHFSGVGATAGADDWLPKAETAITIEYARHVRPLMRRAETDDTLLDEATQRAFAWRKAVQVLGLDDRFATFVAELGQSLERIVRNAFERASERCANHDLTQLVRLTVIDRKARSYGIELTGGSAVERMDNCARFELDMELEWAAALGYAQGDDAMSVRDALTVSATGVPLRLEGALLGVGGEGPLAVTRWSETFTATSDGFTCSTGSLPASPSAPLRATLELDPAKLVMSPPELYLILDPGDVRTPRAPGCGSADPPPPPVYRGAWDALYGSAKTPDGRFRLRINEYMGGDVYARFSPQPQAGSAGFTTWTGRVGFVIRHVPVR
jgi:hypothetical protein